MIQLIAPVTPHLAEELWETYGETSLVLTTPYPHHDPSISYESEEVGEYLLTKVIDDINEILKVTKMQPKKLYIYVAPQWKTQTFQRAIELAEGKAFNVGNLMKELMSDPDNKKRAKELSQYVGKLPGEIQRLNDTNRHRYQIPIDEKHYLINAQTYLKNLYNCEIEIASADEAEFYDPVNKRKFAIPLRPAIYIE